jgi:hypothetical protein
MANVVLWVAQGLVALVLALAGSLKLLLPRERLEPRMHWAASWPRWRIKLLGLAEVAGAAGLILPGLTGLRPGLTPLAAACVAVLMGGAVQTHRRLGEGFVGAVVIGLLCLAIAAGRLLGGAQL